MMSTVRNWLEEIGLGEYADAFEDKASSRATMLTTSPKMSPSSLQSFRLHSVPSSSAPISRK
jgi:hypothetical protein